MSLVEWTFGKHTRGQFNDHPMPHPLYDGRTYLYIGERYNVMKKTCLLRWSVS